MFKFKDLMIEGSGLIVFGFGRFNPPTIGHDKVIEKINSVTGRFENEVVEYTGISGTDLTGCTRGTSAPYRGVTPQTTTAGSHSSGAKVFGAFKITALLTKQELAGYNDSQGNPAYRSIQTGFNFELTSNATSTETGGGFQCTIGPVNDRS